MTVVCNRAGKSDLNSNLRENLFLLAGWLRNNGTLYCSFYNVFRCFHLSCELLL